MTAKRGEKPPVRCEYREDGARAKDLLLRSFRLFLERALREAAASGACIRK